jgi:integrase
MAAKLLTSVGLDAMKAGKDRDTKVPGLYVQATTGSDGETRRSFGFRYGLAGRRRDMGLGRYPAVSLSEARDKARLAAALVVKGLDPLDEAAKTKAEAETLLATSQKFAEAAAAYLKHLKAQRADTKFPGRTAKQWESTLSRFAFPKIGKMDIRDIKHSHIASILEPLSISKETNKSKGAGGPTVAQQLRSRIERILDFAAAHGFRDPDAPNPARPEVLKTVLGDPQPAKHHAAPPVAKAVELFGRIHDAEGSVYRAVEFLILTATRLRETLDARWDEIDFETATWTIPAHRMKTGAKHGAHAVPLSTGALYVLRKQAAIRQNGLVFPGRYGGPRGSSSIAKVLAKIGIGYTVHGWRSTVRTAMADKLGVDRETAEFVLAHVTKGVEAAYLHSTSLDKRRVAMEKLSAWLNRDNNVVSFPTAASA